MFNSQPKLSLTKSIRDFVARLTIAFSKHSFTWYKNLKMQDQKLLILPFVV